ncbi:MAG: DNA mismatch repair endonuclease MutL [Clostridia bacterium]|nr:DNA mismatch repair endonuclease MutL [Clostridia bacterium]
MGNIVLLDDNTINKIAAGEVIERPASVVKELMENSIDAGATAISVEIRNGGISYIRITDNGKGIAPDDMEIAFERHATSKIRKAEDLATVTSMGFRGEALASVAAISKIEMVSRTQDNELGHRIEIEGGRITNKEEAGCPKGTAITITDLFFNTPVRYKFLKKDFTEAGYIEDAVTRLALVHPEVAIKLVNTGKTIIQTPGNNESKTTIYSIYGKDVAENILDVDYIYEDVHITGVIGKPAIARSNRANQLFFVNQRYIKDKTLTSAAEQGYKGMITIGKYGFLVLNIDMDPQKVDVNVHPAKLEVRFEEESKIFKAVYHAIKDTILKGDLVEDTEREKIDFLPRNEEPAETTMVANAKPVEEMKYSNNIEESKDKGIAGLFKKMQNNKEESGIINQPKEEEKSNPNEILVDPFSVSQKPEVITQVEDIKQLDTMETKVIDAKQINEKLIEGVKKLDNLQIDPQTENFDEMYVRTFGSMPVEAKRESEKKAEQLKEEQEKYQVKVEELETAQNISIFQEEDAKKTIPDYKFIGIAFSTYIILELDKELYILDQHAAHERILYEKVKKNYYSEEEKDSQLMLLPDIINLSHKEMDIARENIEMFQKAGFTLEEFGDNTIKLSGVPNICIDLDTKELFLETLDEINTVARTAKQEIEEKFIATVACKAAVKANMSLNKEEVDKLMEQLLVLPNPFTCPHGRPTAIKMTKNDIERKFSRR